MPQPPPFDVSARLRAAIIASGGLASYEELICVTSRHHVLNAARHGVISRVARGRYGLPGHEAPPSASRTEYPATQRAVHDAERLGWHRREALRLGGVLSHRSAAQHHGMGLLVEPSRPEIIIERGRQVTSEPKATVRRRTLRASEVRDGVTTPLRTVLDCMSDLPFWEALAITDSALACSQDGLALVEPLELAEAIGHMPTQYRTRAVRVADHADPRAANPFESAVRAIAVDVPGLNLEPQQSITTPAGVFTVDLAAYDSRIVVEADSFAWHSSKSALIRDARRYNALVAEAWLVLRLTWDAVMNDTATTVDLLTRVVDLQRISATCDACGHTRAQP